jgi:hypothetical protein
MIETKITKFQTISIIIISCKSMACCLLSQNCSLFFWRKFCTLITIAQHCLRYIPQLQLFEYKEKKDGSLDQQDQIVHANACTDFDAKQCLMSTLRRCPSSAIVGESHVSCLMGMSSFSSLPCFRTSHRCDGYFPLLLCGVILSFQSSCCNILQYRFSFIIDWIGCFDERIFVSSDATFFFCAAWFFLSNRDYRRRTCNILPYRFSFIIDWFDFDDGNFFFVSTSRRHSHRSRSARF